MSDIAMITKRLLDEHGCYRRKQGNGFATPLNYARIDKLKKFMKSLKMSTEWLSNNVTLITNKCQQRPPKVYKEKPHALIGSNCGTVYWAVIKLPPSEQEFLQDFLDEFICDPSGFERDLEAYDHVEDITKALKDRLTLIKGE